MFYGYQDPTGRVRILNGIKLEEVHMLKKGALIEYIKRTKLKQATQDRLISELNQNENPKGNSGKKEEVRNPTKVSSSVPKKYKISSVPNSAGYKLGQVVTFQSGHRYKKGREFWNLVE